MTRIAIRPCPPQEAELLRQAASILCWPACLPRAA